MDRFGPPLFALGVVSLTVSVVVPFEDVMADGADLFRGLLVAAGVVMAVLGFTGMRASR